MSKGMTIGGFAHRMGVKASAVRYYERRRLITSDRLPNGYRVYNQDAANALSFVCRAKALGFTLDQIAEILEIRRRDVKPCGRVKVIIECKLADVDRKISQLSHLRRELSALANRVTRSSSAASICPIIENAK